MSSITRMFDELICSVNPDINLKEDLNLGKFGYTYKCLSVRQPWADLIVKGVKSIENRNWFTNHRGPLLIQAPLKFNKDDWKSLQDEGFHDHLMRPEDYHLGYIVGAVEISEVFRSCNSTLGVYDSVWAKTNVNFWWKLYNGIEFENPIQWKGQLSIFNVHDEKNEITKQMAGWRNQVSQ